MQEDDEEREGEFAKLRLAIFVGLQQSLVQVVGRFTSRIITAFSEILIFIHPRFKYLIGISQKRVYLATPYIFRVGDHSVIFNRDEWFFFLVMWNPISPKKKKGSNHIRIILHLIVPSRLAMWEDFDNKMIMQFGSVIASFFCFV